MRTLLPILILAMLAPFAPVAAESVVAARNIRAHEVLSEDDVRLSEQAQQGAARRIQDVVGLETRSTIYAGRPVAVADLAPPAIVERNETVRLNYHNAGLAIATVGRSLDRAAAGESVRVLNLSSRDTVTGIVMIDGSVSVRGHRN